MGGDVLVVVDMQKPFPATKIALKAVAAEIKSAKKQGHFIVFLELRPGFLGHTHHALLGLCKKYKNHAVIEKLTDNGANEVFEVLRQWNYGDFYIVGVNRQACVSHTALRIAQRIKGKVYIVENASYGIEGESPCHYYLWQFQDWQQWVFPKFPTIPTNLFVQQPAKTVAASDLPDNLNINEVLEAA